MKSQNTIQIAAGLLAFAIGQVLSAPAQASDSQLGNASAAQQMPSGAKSKPRFTPAQIAEMQARAELATSIANNVEADAVAKGATSSWRVDLLSSLYSVSSASLRDIAASATTLDQAHTAANAAIARASTAIAKSLGSSTDSLVFTAKTPCRFIDTRNFGGPITTPRDFDTELFGQSYGGATGCTLPGLGEPAFAANVTVIVPAGNAGYLGLRPYGNTTVTSFINWPTSGAPTGIANAGIVATAVNTSNNNHYEFEVFQGGGNAPQFVLDYFGYFSAAPATALSCTTVSNVVSVAPGSSTSFTAVDYSACAAGYTQTGGYCYGPASTMGYLIETGPESCVYRNLSSTAFNGTAVTQCCQVP